MDNKHIYYIPFIIFHLLKDVFLHLATPHDFDMGNVSQDVNVNDKLQFG